MKLKCVNGLLLGILGVVIVACGGGGGSVVSSINPNPTTFTPTPPTTTTSTPTNTSNPPPPSINSLVWKYNASFAGGHVVRWPYKEIKVRVFDSRVDVTRLQVQVDEINSLIVPARLVIDQGSQTTPDITVDYDQTVQLNYGVTFWHYDPSSYEITRTEIKMGPQSNSTGTNFYWLLKHELLHSVGFFGHTSTPSWSVMNPIVTGGAITEEVSQTVKGIYSMTPGTVVAP